MKQFYNKESLETKNRKCISSLHNSQQRVNNAVKHHFTRAEKRRKRNNMETSS
jgi:hypothetical protein